MAGANALFSIPAIPTTIVPAQTVEGAEAAVPPPTPAADVLGKDARVSALAQFVAPEPKKPEAKKPQRKRKIAKAVLPWLMIQVATTAIGFNTW